MGESTDTEPTEKKKTRNELVSEIQTQSAKMRQLQDDLNRNSILIREAHFNFSNLHHEANAQHQALENQIAELGQRQKFLEDSIASMQMDITQNEKRIANLREQEGSIESQFRNDQMSLNTQIDETTDQIGTKKTEIEQEYTGIDAAISAYNTNVNTLNTALASLSQDEVAKSQSLRAAKGAENEAALNLLKLQDENQAIQERLNETTSQYREAISQQGEINRELSVKQQRLENVGTDLETSNEQVKNLKENLALQQTAISELRTSLDQNKENLADLESKLSAAKAAKAAEAGKMTREALTKGASKVTMALYTAGKAIRAFFDPNYTVESALPAQEIELENMAAEASTPSMDDISQLEERIAELRGTVASEGGRLDALQANAKKTDKQLRSSRNENQTLHSEQARLETEIEGLTEEARVIDQEVNSLNQQIRLAEEKQVEITQNLSGAEQAMLQQSSVANQQVLSLQQARLKVADKRVERENVMLAHAQDLEVREDRIEGLYRGLNRLRATHQELTEELHSKQLERDQLLAQCDSAIHGLKAQNKSMEREVVSHHTEQQQVQNATDLAIEVRDAKKQHYEERIKKLNKEILGLEQTLETNQIQINETQAALATSRQDMQQRFPQPAQAPRAGRGLLTAAAAAGVAAPAANGQSTLTVSSNAPALGAAPISQASGGGGLATAAGQNRTATAAAAQSSPVVTPTNYKTRANGDISVTDAGITVQVSSTPTQVEDLSPAQNDAMAAVLLAVEAGYGQDGKMLTITSDDPDMVRVALLTARSMNIKQSAIAVQGNSGVTIDSMFNQGTQSYTEYQHISTANKLEREYLDQQKPQERAMTLG